MKPLKVALLGCGVVGSQVIRLIHEQGNALALPYDDDSFDVLVSNFGRRSGDFLSVFATARSSHAARAASTSFGSAMVGRN